MSTRAERLQATGFLVLAIAVAAPFAGFLNANRAEIIDLWRTAVIYLGVVLVVSAVYAAVVLVFANLDPRATAYGAATVVLVLFEYDALFGTGRFARPVALVLWLVLAVGAPVVVYRLTTRPNLRTFAGLFLVILAAMPALSYVLYKQQQTSTPAAAAPASPDLPLPGDLDQDWPDIYWFVLDEYGRPDQLEATGNIDNAFMIDEFEDRGFEVYDETYTSYPVTALSLSTVLEMQYVLTDEDQLDAGVYELTAPLRGESAVVDYLKELGYAYTYSDPGLFEWNTCNPDVADHCIAPARRGLPLSELDLSLVNLTPLSEFDLAPAPYNDPLDVVEEAQSIDDGDRPKFVYAHVLSPHEPYWFKKDCTRRSRPKGGGFLASEYGQEISCLNDRILGAVDAILDEDPEAWIIVQSDTGSKHGIKMSDALEDYSAEGLKSRYAVFEATHLPDACRFPDSTRSTVNTFRLVLSCLAGEKADLLPYRGFFWRHVAPEEMQELERPPWTP